MKRLSMLIAALAIQACGSFTPTAIRREKVESVRKMAIVGFSFTNGVAGNANERKSKSGLFGLINSAKEVSSAVSGDDAARARASIDGVYATLAAELAARFHWEIAGADRLARSAMYARRLKERPTSGMLDLAHRKDGIVSYKSARDLLDPTTLAQLCADIGVDGVIAFDVRMTRGKEDTSFAVASAGKEVTGSYRMHPAGQISVALYEKTSAEPAWLREFITGNPADSGIRTVLGVEDRSDEPVAFVDATKKAWNGQKIGSPGEVSGLGICPPSALWTAL